MGMTTKRNFKSIIEQIKNTRQPKRTKSSDSIASTDSSKSDRSSGQRSFSSDISEKKFRDHFNDRGGAGPTGRA